MNTTRSIFSIFVLFGLIFYSCNSPNSAEQEVFEDFTGVLKWGGSPAVDGSGLVLETGDKTYGVLGDKSDYDHIFDDNSNQADVHVDFMITGNNTVRGWGVTYKEVKILSIERLPQTLK